LCLILKNSDDSDFERLNKVFHFLQMPGFYIAFILGIFYSFQNSANIISFLTAEKKKFKYSGNANHWSKNYD